MDFTFFWIILAGVLIVLVDKAIEYLTKLWK